MGRYSGFITLEACLASSDVDVCLIPEFKFNLYGKNGVFQYILSVLKRKKFCVVVVAEGAGDGILDSKQKIEVFEDKSGNKKTENIGELIKKELIEFGKEEAKIDITIKFIEPTYMIRSIPANSEDSKRCVQLA